MNTKNIVIGLCVQSIAGSMFAETRVYFGDLHLHTRCSNDMFAFYGTTQSPDDTYRVLESGRAPRWFDRSLAYGMGRMASFWLITRVAAIVAV